MFLDPRFKEAYERAKKIRERVKKKQEAKKKVEEIRETARDIRRGKKTVADIVREKTEEKRPTYETVETEIKEAKVETVKAALQVRDPRTRLEMLRHAKTLQEQQKQIAELKEEGYQIKKETTGDYTFYKTPEQVEQEIVSEQKEKIRPYYDKPSPAGFAHMWSTGILSWEDPLSLKSLYYTFAGDREKIIETKARASLDLDKALKEGPGAYTLKVATGPFATVGTAFVGGAVIAKAVPYTAGFLTARYGPLAASAFKAGTVATGVGLVSIPVMDIKTELEQDRPAEAFSKAGMLGFQLGAGYLGYRTVTKPQQTSLFTRGQQRFYTKHPEQIKLTFGRVGEKTDVITRIKWQLARGTPMEKTGLKITEMAKYKPGKEWSAMSQKALETRGLTFVKGGVSTTAQVRGYTISQPTKPLFGGTRFKAWFGRFIGKKVAVDIKQTGIMDFKQVTMDEAGGFGGLSRTIQRTVPTQILKPVQVPTFISQFKPMTVPVFVPQVGYRTERVPVMVQPSLLKPVSMIKYDFASRFRFKPTAVPDVTVVPISLFRYRYKYDTRQVVDVVPRQMYTTVVRPVTSIRYKYPAFPGLPTSSLNRLGMGSYPSGWFGKAYRKREFKMGHLLKGFKT